MDIKPDYESYTTKELREALHGIDHEAYPDRVEEIEKWLSLRLKESPEEPKQNPGFWIRFVAYFIDGLILVLTIFFTSLLVYGTGGEVSPSDRNLAVEIILNIVFPIVYFVFFWTKYGATPGKLVMGIRVVSATTNQPPNTWQGLARYLGYIISSIPLCLGFIWAAWHPEKKAWHDMLARTVVIWANETE